MNLNFIEFIGKGAAISEAPEVTAARRPGHRQRSANRHLRR